MKVRNGFVSNSSSSSFVIVKAYLHSNQLNEIINHQEECVKWAMSCSDDEQWDIEDHGRVITGKTDMDNFSMNKFLSYIGIKAHLIEWDL